MQRRASIGLGLSFALGLAAAASPVRAQDDYGEGGGETAESPQSADGSATPPPAGDGWASPPVEAVDHSLGFAAPPPGVVRIMPHWDNTIFTTSQSLGTFGSLTITTWTPTFGVDVDLGFAVLRANVPLAYFRDTNSSATTSMSSDQAELGNLTLEGLANIELGAEHRLLIGGGVALPTATDQPCETGSCGGIGGAIRQIAWATNFRGAAQWANQSFTLWPSVEYRLGVPWILFSATGTIPIFFPLNSHIGGPLSRGNVELMLAIDLSGAVRIVNMVDVGISFLGWAMPSGAGLPGNPDLGQTALSFFVRTDPELDAPVTGGAEFIMNLDNSWGPTGDPGKLWGLRLFIGGRFDV